MTDGGKSRAMISQPMGGVSDVEIRIVLTCTEMGLCSFWQIPSWLCPPVTPFISARAGRMPVGAESNMKLLLLTD